MNKLPNGSIEGNSLSPADKARAVSLHSEKSSKTLDDLIIAEHEFLASSTHIVPSLQVSSVSTSSTLWKIKTELPQILPEPEPEPEASPVGVLKPYYTKFANLFSNEKVEPISSAIDSCTLESDQSSCSIVMSDQQVDAITAVTVEIDNEYEDDFEEELIEESISKSQTQTEEIAQLKSNESKSENNNVVSVPEPQPELCQPILNTNPDSKLEKKLSREKLKTTPNINVKTLEITGQKLAIKETQILPTFSKEPGFVLAPPPVPASVPPPAPVVPAPAPSQKSECPKTVSDLSPVLPKTESDPNISVPAVRIRSKRNCAKCSGLTKVPSSIISSSTNSSSMSADDIHIEAVIQAVFNRKSLDALNKLLDPVKLAQVKAQILKRNINREMLSNIFRPEFINLLFEDDPIIQMKSLSQWGSNPISNEALLHAVENNGKFFISNAALKKAPSPQSTPKPLKTGKHYF